MAATFAPRREPLLALVPRRSIEKKQQTERAKAKQSATSPLSRPEPERHAQRGASALQSGADDGKKRSDSHEAGSEGEARLGERFLRAMAQLSRLARTPLDAPGTAEAPWTTPSRSSSAKRGGVDASAVDSVGASASSRTSSSLQLLPPVRAAPSPPKAGTGGSPMRTQLVVLNSATEPLHEHLTFEISMLLPPPMDSRQRSLQSPIRRERLRKRRRRRRRKKRPLRREWRTSVTTWAPHMASDYAEAREASAWRRNHEFQLAQQMQQLDARRSHVPSTLATSVSAPLLLHGRPERGAPVDEQPESDTEGGTSDEGDEDEEDEEGEGDERGSDTDVTDASDTEEAAQASGGASLSTDHESLAAQSASAQDVDGVGDGAGTAAPRVVTMASRHALRHHRPAWITAELRAWLVDSGLFHTSSSASNRSSSGRAGL